MRVVGQGCEGALVHNDHDVKIHNLAMDPFLHIHSIKREGAFHSTAHNPKIKHEPGMDCFLQTGQKTLRTPATHKSPLYLSGINFDAIVDILARFEKHRRCRSSGPLPFPVRPPHTKDSDVSRIFVEDALFTRRSYYGSSHQLDCWRSTGGKKGGTLVGDTNPARLSSDTMSQRRFRRKYGRIDINKIPTGRRYRSYVEIDGRDNIETGPTIYFIVPDSKHCFGNKIAPVVVRQVEDGDLKKPLLALQSTNQDQRTTRFLSFEMNSRECGNISSTGAGGVVMCSAAGDFAEWHEMMDTSQKLPEGTIVGFYEGKINTDTTDSRILGVVSGRPCVVGSVNADKDIDDGAMVAYCGRVPVRVIGPVIAGDQLVPSGRDDGVAEVLHTQNSGVYSSCEEASCSKAGSSVSSQCTIGVALHTDSRTGEILVESSVTPPSMTKEVMVGLHGRSRAERAAKRLLRVLVVLALSALVALAVYSSGVATHHGNRRHDVDRDSDPSTAPYTGPIVGPDLVPDMAPDTSDSPGVKNDMDGVEQRWYSEVLRSTPQYSAVRSGGTTAARSGGGARGSGGGQPETSLLKMNHQHGLPSTHLSSTVFDNVQLAEQGSDLGFKAPLLDRPEENQTTKVAETVDERFEEMFAEQCIDRFRFLVATGATNISVRRYQCNDVAFLHISRMLMETPQIQSLDFTDNHCTGLGARYLAEAMAALKHLDYLCLDKNMVGDEGSAAMAKAAAGSSTLTSLSLNNNKITDRGASAIAAYLHETALLWLSLESNYITDKGAIRLERSLLTSKICYLNLDFNFITEKGADQFNNKEYGRNVTTRLSFVASKDDVLDK